MQAMQHSHAASLHDVALQETRMQFDVDIARVDEDVTGRIFVPSRAATPEPCSPRSRPIALKSPSERSSPALYEPYPTPNATPTRRRARPAGNKRSVNAFIIYRREFPSRYPHIDALERHQGPKSSIIGAMWRAEPVDVREYFFRLQAAAEEEFRKAHGTTDAPRADPVKTLMRRERARQRRTRDDKLLPRSELIVKLWMEKKSVEDFVKAVQDYDEQNKATTKSEPKMKIVMSGSPLSNHTNTPMDDDVPLPSTPVLQIQTNFITCADTPGLTAHPGSPVESPVPRTPSPTPAPSPMVALPDPHAQSADNIFDSFEPKPAPEAFDLDYFSALLDLVPLDLDAAQALPPMPDADVLMAQLFPSASFTASHVPWNGLEDDFGAASTSGADFMGEYDTSADVVTGWSAYTDGSFDYEHASGLYAFGNENDLLGLETYGNLMEPVDNLVDCYIEMSCVPP